jgi:hypothetical protein
MASSSFILHNLGRAVGCQANVSRFVPRGQSPSETPQVCLKKFASSEFPGQLPGSDHSNSGYLTIERDTPPAEVSNVFRTARRSGVLLVDHYPPPRLAISPLSLASFKGAPDGYLMQVHSDMGLSCRMISAKHVLTSLDSIGLRET